MKYNRTNVLSLQLRSMTALRKLTRAEFFTRLQLVRTVEPMVDEAYRISEEKIHRENSDDSPHGQPWHVSFHGSQFPGDDPKACPRQALYRMMNFPLSGPTSRLLSQTAAQGKATEANLVETWHNAGMLLSSPDPYNQTGFEFSDAWLTSSVDAVVQISNTRKPMPVEIKQRKAEVVAQMQLGRGPFPDHVKQIKVQIAFIRLYQEANLWLSLDEGWQLCTHGTIYYVSRDNPLDTAEFRIDHDEHFFNAGIEQLRRWRAYFEEDYLPELNPGKRSSRFGHPNGWKWSYPPCTYCPFKKTCQLDFQQSTTQLSASIGVDRAKKVRPEYDVETARLKVKARWLDRKHRDSDPRSPEQSKAS